MPELSLVSTSDGSLTLYNAEVGEHYHSRHGALQESRHVFINSGLKYFLDSGHSNAKILEIGFGTGLNFLLSADHMTVSGYQLYYTGIEAFPISIDLIRSTGYGKYVSLAVWNSFTQQYELCLNNRQWLSDLCSLEISACKLMDFNSTRQFDVIYFDAFAAVHQPGMWTAESIAHACSFLKPGGVFVPYAITGHLKRIMRSLGFTIEKAPGAPGKREMLRATNTS